MLGQYRERAPISAAFPTLKVKRGEIGLLTVGMQVEL